MDPLLQTPRLDLLPATSEFLKLLIAGKYALAGDLLDVTVPNGWPFEEAPRTGLAIHLAAMEEDPSERLWRIRLIVLRSNRTVIGSINLKGPPQRKSGIVEIGWGVTAEYRRQGIATEATNAVTKWVLSHPGVRGVVATIPDDNPASQSLAKRLGMQRTQELHRSLPVWELQL